MLALCAGASLIGCGGSGGTVAEPDSESDDDWGDEVPETAGTEYTGSAIETFVRLFDMGLERYVVASALRGMLGQRLVAPLMIAA